MLNLSFVELDVLNTRKNIGLGVEYLEFNPGPVIKCMTLG